MRVAGFVLVGGASSRMGRDKARLPFDSHLLVEEVAQQVASVAQLTCLVGAPERYGDLSLECLPDLRAGCGPLAGIEAALASGRGEWNLIVSCDLPGLRTSWLRGLLGQAGAGQSERKCVVMRDSAGRVHPLCGVYHASCLPGVQQALDRGSLRLHDLITEIGAAYLTLNAYLANVNSPADWLAWQARRASDSAREGRRW